MITAPAVPEFPRIFLVEEILIPIRNNVVIKSMDGKIENSSGSLIFMLISKMINEMEIFKIIKTSNTNGFNGMINNSTIITTITATALFNSFFIFYSRLFLFFRKTCTRTSATTP